MTVTVPSDLTLVEHVVELVMREGLACGLSMRTARFNLRVAVAEALANAMVYGNQLDPAKRVHLATRHQGEGIHIEIKDEGDGFDPTAIPDPRGSECLDRDAGRGLFLIRELVDELAFDQGGTAVCLTLRSG